MKEMSSQTQYKIGINGRRTPKVDPEDMGQGYLKELYIVFKKN